MIRDRDFLPPPDFFSPKVEFKYCIVNSSSDLAGPRMKQVHGIAGIRREKNNQNQIPEADWTWTSESEIDLWVCVADCTAILLEGESSEGDFVAALHAGWRGTAQGIIEEFWKMVRPTHVRAWLSPALCQKHFEVGPEVIEALGEDGGSFARNGEGDRSFLDHRGLQKARLQKYGAMVSVSPFCTFCEDELVSYRRAQGHLEKRLAFAISLKSP